jgi:hypothetical protein
MLNPVIVPFWSTTTGGSTRVTTRSSEGGLCAIAAAVIAAMITSPAAIRPNTPAITAPSRINPLAARL